MFLGVDLGGTKISVSVGTESGKILAKQKFPTVGKPGENLAKVEEIGKRLLDGNKCEGVGVSAGGPLDDKRGIIVSAPHLPLWYGYPLTEDLTQRFHAPAFLENDANACAVAEWKWGAGKGTEDMVFLTFGTGFGAGLILDGKLYRGASCMAGEIGHVRLSRKGPLCYGKHGSVESFCSGAGISLLSADGKSAKDVCDAARRGDAHAKKVISVSAHRLGEAVSMLVDILNPEVVVLGSIFVRAEDLYRAMMEQVVLRESLKESSCVCRIVPAVLGEDLGDMAALAVAMDGGK